MQTSRLRSGGTPAKTRTACACALMAVIVCAAVASAAQLPATGDDERLWVARTGPNGNTFTLLYREVGQEHPGIRPIMAPLRGRLVPGGMTASNRRLWLLYEPQSPQHGASVQSIRIPTWSPTTTILRPIVKIQPALPPAARLRSLASGRDSLWALVHAPNAIARLDPSDNPNPQIGATPKNAPLPSQSTAPSIETDPGYDRSAALTATSLKDHLLQLDRNRWRPVDLPDGWPHESHAWLVMRRPTDAHPHLLTLHPADDGAALRVYRHESGSWLHRTYDLQQTTVATDLLTSQTTAVDGQLFPLAVDGQIVIGQVQQDPNQVQVALSVLRQGSAIPLGDLSITGQGIESWVLVPHGQTVALMVMDQDAKIKWAHIDLQGRQPVPPSDLAQSVTIPLEDAADNVVLVSVLILATAVMFGSWRRDPSWHRLNLPEGVTLAQVSQRFFAGAIDLSPCLLVSLLLFEVEPVDLIRENWPGRSGGWRQMAPGATAIGLFVLHTLVSELLINQTVGKRILGLRVVSLDGQRPTRWQIIVRCVTKAFDLVAWLLLILPMVGPYRQRLGDLIARTVVVVPEPKAPPSQPES